VEGCNSETACAFTTTSALGKTLPQTGKKSVPNVPFYLIARPGKRPVIAGIGARPVYGLGVTAWKHTVLR
jgi:hypothetical protein